MPTKKKPQDATMRNVRASNRRHKLLEERVSALETIVDEHSSILNAQTAVKAEKVLRVTTRPVPEEDDIPDVTEINRKD